MLLHNIKLDGDAIVFDGNYLECYIPDYYFQRSFAEQAGSTLKVFGVFSLRTFDGKGKPDKLETLSLPLFISLFAVEVEERTIALLPNRDPEKYHVAKFYKGNKIMSKYVIPDSTNVEIFLKMMLQGKLPDTIPYDKIIDIWHSNLKLNNVSIGTTSCIPEIIISEIYRDRKNPDKKFATTVGKDPSTSMYDYKTANIREICARQSTFTAITFEDMDSMITSSLNMDDSKEQVESPIEKIIKM